MINLSVVFLLINLMIIYGLFKLISRVIQPRFTRGVAFKVFLVYSVVLIMSPLIAAFALDLESAPEDVIDTPKFYYSEVLQDYQNRTLEGLKKDAYLKMTEETRIPLDAVNQAGDGTLLISSAHQGNDYSFHQILEVTDEVEEIVITQFQQRAHLHGIDITEQLTPWRWAVTGNRLQAEILPTDIDMHVVFPIRHYFHFDRDHTLSDTHFTTVFPNIGNIQWIQIPQELPFDYLGDTEFLKLIERR